MRDSRCVPAFPRMGFAWALSLFLGAQVGLFGQTGKGGGNSDSQTGPEAALTNGLWAHYPLDGNASDNSGNGHHGESNQTQLTHDRFGRPNRAFDFDGNNSAVYLPIGSEFNSSVDSLSVSLWAKVRDPSRGTLFEQGTEFNKGRDILSFIDNNLTSKLGGGAIFVKKLPEMNVWRHYLITYEVSMGAAHRKFYVDGQLFGSDSNDTLENSSLNFMLGLDVLANFPFDGAMDSVRIWRRALSAVQVAALYQIESANPTPPKVEVSGSVSYDGVVPGPIRVLAYRPNGNLAAQTLLASGESAFSLSLTDNRSYDLFAFQDRDDNGSYNAYYEPGDHYGGWNKSSQSFDLLSVEGARAGIQLHLTDLDSDEDGYENWYEYQAGTAINDPESIPGIGFGLMGRWRIRGEFNATIEDSAAQKAEATLRNENNASARYYEVGHRPAFLLDSGAVTIFFKHDSITGRQGYLSKDARGLKNGGHVSIYQIDGNLTARLQSASKSYSIQVPDCIVPNRWNHLVFQWGPGGMTLWLNGQSVGSDPYAGGLGSTSGGSGNEEPLFIGAGGWKYEDEDPSTVVGFFDGEVQLALLHSRKLTPLEIASHVHTSKISVNRRPYGLTLDQNQISENQSAGTLLGVLSAMDDDYNANLTYALNYYGQGGPFAVQPDGTVVTTRPIDYEETPQLELFARVSDEYDAKQWKKFVIEVLDLDEVPDTEESPGPQAPGSDKESGENDPAGESPKSEESDGGKGPETSSPETESEKEPASPSIPLGEGKQPGQG
ncbi:MAG: LamG-like jellyroll fold domain-containing protein [Verrucomicrobiota bacterium]|nr:LamG-like jellyroll fold domain-containing protein [Verrucomicrobiota bacterium]